MSNLPPLSLYIHIPWCTRICPYCNFNVFKKKQSIQEKKYIEHLLKDFKNDILLSSNRQIKTIFIGGGTPSLLSKKSIKYLLDSIRETAFISKFSEITIESNSTISEIKKFLDYKKLGINRFSIGMQTFNKKQLKILKKDPNNKKTLNIIKNLKNFKINNTNLELMYGLPQQTLKTALLDLMSIIQLNSQHISWYPLYLEPHTPFYSNKIMLPNHDILWDIYVQGEKMLKQAGYKKYAISSYSKKKNIIAVII